MSARPASWFLVSLACAAVGCGSPAAKVASAPTTADAAQPTPDSSSGDATIVADSAPADAGAATALVVAADRPVLDWTGTSAIARNAAYVPADFQDADPHACAKDPTRQYIGELFSHGLKDIQVDWHWAPVVPGPNLKHRTLGQPEISLAGELLDYSEGTDDVLADHPFGFDVNSDVQLDAPYALLSGHKFDPKDEEAAHGMVHAEVELRAFPRAAFGYKPKPGDRALMRGAWVLDCGHPPYGTEMHPPSFLAYARALDAKTAIALAFVTPYRSSLLFAQDVALATDLTNTARFDDPGVAGFSNALIAAVVSAVSDAAPFLTAHALMIGNRFDTLDWLTCAPLPRPTGAKLTATWRFATRTGVTLTAAPDDASGCVRFTATMAADYVPMPLPFTDTVWSWEKLSASAGGQLGQSVDVRKEVLKIVTSMGFSADAPALQADHPPHVDAYAELKPRAGADLDAPTAIDAMADDQPFPFHGRARVGWQVP